MLTTVSLASSCVTQTWLSWSPEVGRAAIVLGNPHDPNCWPGTRDLGITISPALCPDGYTSACDITNARRDASETVWACCPSNFWCDWGFWSCVNDHTNGVNRTYTVTDTDAFGNTITTQAVGDGGVNAHSIRVAFHLSDLLTPTSDPPSPTTITSIPSAASPRPLTLSFPTSTSEPTPPARSAEGVPPGAWAGIGVGVTAGATILLSGVVWLLRRKFGKRQQSPGQQDNTGFPREPCTNNAQEIDSVMRPAELNGYPGLYELEAKAKDPAWANRRLVA
ncbi:hypothetical protein F5X98DRAFT_59845 [Xylaria grammica]|nr:hypothetical protein F5X98DRAFT_59845 [Xylaria grammica]